MEDILRITAIVEVFLRIDNQSGQRQGHPTMTDANTTSIDLPALAQAIHAAI